MTVVNRTEYDRGGAEKFEDIGLPTVIDFFREFSRTSYFPKKHLTVSTSFCNKRLIYLLLLAQRNCQFLIATKFHASRYGAKFLSKAVEPYAPQSRCLLVARQGEIRLLSKLHRFVLFAARNSMKNILEANAASKQ